MKKALVLVLGMALLGCGQSLTDGEEAPTVNGEEVAAMEEVVEVLTGEEAAEAAEGVEIILNEVEVDVSADGSVSIELPGVEVNVGGNGEE